MPKHLDQPSPYAVPMVRVDEVAAAVGHAPEAVVHAAQAIGIECQVFEDWAGYPSVHAETAALMVGGLRDHYETHSSKWGAYQRYLITRRQAAEDERQKRATLEREAAQRAAKKRQETWTEELARKTELDIAEREAAKAARDGRPVAFDKFAEAG